ncbi:transposase [Streptomyces iakyrus]|uniref:IS110 family transposase n=1 Tax=Streptomyces iakyrus TaxID=68219 RepID=UPI0038149C37
MSSSTVSSTSSVPRTRRPAGEVVLGVDTHRDVHVAAVLSVSGAVLATDEFPASAAGYRALLKRARAWGTVRRAGVEGTGSYGASLSRYLLAQGVDVFDVNRMDRASSSAWQVRFIRCPECGASRVERAGPCSGQIGRRAGADRANVQTHEGVGRQSPHAGHQPAQGRPRHCGPRLAGRNCPDWAMPNSSVPAHSSPMRGVATRSARSRWCRLPGSRWAYWLTGLAGSPSRSGTWRLV